MPPIDEYLGPYAIGDQYAKVVFKPYASGIQCQEKLGHQPDGVWCLDLKNFHPSLKAIDPNAYFITSGEAVIKMERLCNDLKAAHQIACKLLSIVKALRGNAKYLETQWEMDNLLLKKKNPRPSSRNSQRKLGNVRAETKRKDQSDQDDDAID